jgi:hypothetical protein
MIGPVGNVATQRPADWACPLEAIFATARKGTTSLHGVIRVGIRFDIS